MKAGPTRAWRAWIWDDEHGMLCSPMRGTRWDTPELIAEQWSDAAALRGEAGIHACYRPEHVSQACDAYDVLGQIERWGRYVHGTDGYRCERAVIVGLVVPSIELLEKISLRYPEIPCALATRWGGNLRLPRTARCPMLARIEGNVWIWQGGRVDLSVCASVGGDVIAHHGAHVDLSVCASVGGCVIVHPRARVNLSACTSVEGGVWTAPSGRLKFAGPRSSRAHPIDAPR